MTLFDKFSSTFFATSYQVYSSLKGSNAFMAFIETAIHGATIIEPQFHHDERGFFARTFSIEEFEQHSLNPAVVQCSVSFNHTRGTLRGMHYQVPPRAETKLVRCTMGAIYDVIIDLRPDSPSYMKYIGVELSAENRRALYIPHMCAHGYQTLTENAEVFYQISEVYAPEYARGVRYNDPAFSIEWKLPVTVINERDANYPLIQSA
jgi:dTDP-4-dehydrorhamnose 3,5-epimerase